MSNTSIKPSARQWLGRWVSGQPHQIIGSTEDPYLLRWYIIPRNPLFNVYLHKFLRSDDDRALHDHPWWFLSLMLWGSYIEVTERSRTVRSAPEPWRWFFGDHPVAFRPALWRHRVELIGKYPTLERASEIPCWTLIVTGRRVRTWGFWCQDWDTTAPLTGLALSPPDPVERFVPWDEFGDAGCGELS